MVLVGFFALFLGFGPYSLELKRYYFQTYAFYITLIAITIWIWTLFPKSISKKNITPHIPAFILACLLITSISFISPPQLRVLYDETNLLGVAQAMFEQRTFYIPTQALFYNQNIHVIDFEWGVRPLVFPFLLHLIHLIKGYTPTNIYLLNACAGIFALFSFYLLLQRFFSKPLALVGMGLLSAYPIFALRTTSGGYEILNVGLAIFAFYQFHSALTSKTPHHTTRVIFTLLILAQIRYESALFLCALAPFIIYHCIKHFRTIPHKIVLTVPLLLLPTAWQRTLYSGNDAFMVREGASMFGIENFISNIQHAFHFFAATQSTHGTLPILFYIAIVGTILGLIHATRNRQNISQQTQTILLSASLACALLSTITLGYYLANLTRPIGLRWGIIFLPFFITPIVYLCNLAINKKSASIYPILLATSIMIYIGWFQYLPNASVHNLRLNQINQAYTNFFQETDPQKKALIISPYSRLFVPHQRSAVTFDYANQNWQEILAHVQSGRANKIFVCQIANAQTQTMHTNTQLTHKVPLEPLGELQVGTDLFFISQISLPK